LNASAAYVAPVQAGRVRIARGLVVLAVIGLAQGIAEAAEAFELLSVESTRDGPAYELRIEARFHAAPERLLAVLTDYGRIHELHPRMVESGTLGRVGPATEEVQTRFEGCVLFFCRTLYRVEHVRVEGLALYAEDIPRRGSFSEGRTTWRFTPTPDGTLLHYQSSFIPAFRVPPVIGRGALARSVEQMTIETMAEVERMALRRND
jgi:hypothetical protein